MARDFSARIVKAIHKAVQEAEADNGILDAYAAAERIRVAYPEDGVTIAELVDFMISSHGGSRAIELSPPMQSEPALATSLKDLLHIVIGPYSDHRKAAFYVANAKASHLYHVTGMSPSYARHVDGFVIGASSLACGLAVHQRRPVVTVDVTEEPLWKPWVWLADVGGYRACWSFPVETPAGKAVGSFAIYHSDRREAASEDLDLAAAITRVAARIISPPH